MTAEQPESVAANQSQPGASLRKAREGRNMSLADVAAALNLSTTAVQNLESGAFERLPGSTFARGYIRAYAKLLGMDQELLVREYDQATGSDAMGSSVNSLGRIEEPARVSHGLLRMLSLAVLTLLVLAGFLWWQDNTADKEDASLSSGFQQVEVESADGTTQIHPIEPEDQAVELAQEQVVAPVEEQSAETAESAEQVTQETVSVVAPVVVGDMPPTAVSTIEQTPLKIDAETAVSIPVTPDTPAPAEGDVTVGAGEGLLALQFTANCWTQVTDADGKVLISGLKKAGETIQLAVKLPLELRLGFASGAQVTFNGKAVDTLPFSTGETARLKLGQ